jgi:hypothetical protein
MSSAVSDPISASLYRVIYTRNVEGWIRSPNVKVCRHILLNSNKSLYEHGLNKLYQINIFIAICIAVTKQEIEATNLYYIKIMCYYRVVFYSSEYIYRPGIKLYIHNLFQYSCKFYIH